MKASCTRLGRGAVALFAMSIGTSALASSHREAPFITKNPKVDATDFYMFRSYEPRPRRLRHPDRQLSAAAGRLRRPQLLHPGSRGALRDPPRQRRRRQGGPDLPVPLRQRPRRRRQGLHARRRRQEDRRPARQHRPRHRRRRPSNAERHRDLHRRRRARRPPRQGPRRGRQEPDQRRRAARRRSPSRPTTSAPRPSARRRATPTTPSAHIYDVQHPAAAPRAAALFVGQRAESFARQPGHDLRPLNAPAAVVVGGVDRAGRAPGAQHDRRQEHHHARARAARSRASSAARRRDRRLDHRRACAQARVLNPRGHLRAAGARGRRAGPRSRACRMPLVNELVIGLPDKDRFNGSRARATTGSSPTTSPTPRCRR